MEFKGYRNPNGNYITKAEQQQSNKKFLKEMKEYRIQKQQEEERQEKIRIAKYLDEKKQEQQAIEQEQLFIHQAKQFVSYAAETLQYKEYLIAWDIANRNRMQIETDIYNNKITLEQVKKVFTLAQNYIDNLTDKIYMKDLLSA
ncbi:hypothetical protein KQI61_07655 [Anaerocolumna aminovalerica]|uniref:hypothetical protein n=1 Tax=Anaerocolumna aminovalerica TaxID=1527 RepID=UPI001C0EDA68|nr:hypothetical protein [Anaerocolumna aminovalerica]MBU5332071.1 hypothetical protein [Anaerocolumna aminovalerica]